MNGSTSVGGGGTSLGSGDVSECRRAPPGAGPIRLEPCALAGSHGDVGVQIETFEMGLARPARGNHRGWVAAKPHHQLASTWPRRAGTGAFDRVATGLVRLSE
jgi:hypothetical protein